MKAFEFENSALKEANNKEMKSIHLKISKAYSDNAYVNIYNARLVAKNVDNKTLVIF